MQYAPVSAKADRDATRAEIVGLLSDALAAAKAAKNRKQWGEVARTTRAARYRAMRIAAK